MKELTLFFQKTKHVSLEEIRFFVFSLFVFSLPFDRIYSQLFIIVLLVLVLIDFNVRKLKAIPKGFWIFQTVFLLTAVGLFNTSAGPEMKDGLFLLEKQLALLLLPLLIPLSFTVSAKRVRLTLKTFTAAVTLSIVYLLISHYFLLLELDIPFKQYLETGLFYNHLFSAPLNMHASYLSMFASLSIFYILDELNHKENRQKVVLYIQLLFLLLGMLLLVSRSNIFVLFLISLVVYPFFIQRGLKTKLLRSFLILAIGIGLFALSPYFKNRFSTELAVDMQIKSSDSEPRIVRWKEAVNLIKESPILGKGTGAEIIKLREKYWEKGLIYSFQQKYNAHNQYLSILIKHGIIGFVIFIAAFLYYFKLAYRKKSFIYLAFLIQIAIIFMVENVLDMNKGIFYFATFNTLFGYFHLHQVNKKEHEPASVNHNSVV